jgi:hypothetical protein
MTVPNGRLIDNLYNIKQDKNGTVMGELTVAN